MKHIFFVKVTIFFALLSFFAFDENLVRAEILNNDNAQPNVEKKELVIIEKEIMLDSSNDFTNSVQINLQSSKIEGFDGAKVTVECGKHCAGSSDSTGKVTIKLNKTNFFNKTDELRDLKISYNLNSDNSNPEKPTQTIPLKIPKRISNLKFDSKKISLVKGQELTPPTVSFTLDGKDKGTDGKTYAPTLEIDEYLTVSGESDSKKYKAAKVGTTKLVYKFNELTIAEIPLENLAPIGSIERKSNTDITLTENSSDSVELVVKDLEDTPIKDFPNRIVCNAKPSVKNYVSPKIKGGAVDLVTEPVGGDNQKDEIVCKVKDPKGDDKKDDLLSFSVKIIPKKGYITINNPGGSNVLLPNGTLTFLVNLFNLEGNRVTGGIEYSLAERDDNQWVSLSKQGQQLTVSWVDLPLIDPETRRPISSRPQFVRIAVKANINEGSSQIFETITVHLASVVRFATIRVKLQPMDERTVTDLYGKPTANEYHVLMVRLFNDLKDKTNSQNQGESILAYSSSIEVAVSLEKQYDKGSNTGGLGSFSKEQMKELENERNEKLFQDYKKNLVTLDKLYEDILKHFNEAMQDAIQKDTKAQSLEIVYLKEPDNKEKRKAAEDARNESDLAYQQAYNLAEKMKNVYRINALSTPKLPAPDLPIMDGKWYPASPNDLMQASIGEGDYLSNSDDDDNNTISLNDGEPNCVGTITYKPFTFEMMVNTVDRRAERSVRSRIFKIMNTLALGGSAFTSVAVPSGGNDLTLGLEKFGNFFIPGLEKLFPSMKEQYRQNIVSQTMKPIEEIPFGSDITRVLFVPKQPIRGLVAANKVRISQICPYYFKIKVAVISKKGEVKLGGQKVQ